MKIVNEHIERVKSEILSGFNEPLKDNLLAEFIMGKSKRIRSLVALTYLKTFNCELNSNIYKILAVGEILHNASLLHDDVLDEAVLRRGESSMVTTLGNKQSILAGDYLVAFAMEKLVEVNNSELTNMFLNCAKEMTMAEIKQCNLRGEELSLEEYIDICKGKTARLFSVIIGGSALISGLSKDKAIDFGELFGLCFQFKNDIEDYSRSEDLKNGIKTIVDIAGIENAKSLSDNYKKRMRDILQSCQDSVYKKNLEELINKL